MMRTAQNAVTAPFRTQEATSILRRASWVAAAVVGVVSVTGCERFSPTVRQVGPGVLTVTTAPGATLEVLDWGGGGPALVFLAGGGHTAHEFDEFAPQLSDAFHVIGVTRRGVGESSGARARGPRDAIMDLAAVLDALGLDSVVLVGHSQGGLEAARFAQAFPERCKGIVHLDSAYLGGEAELGDIFRTTPPPAPPAKTPTDSSSARAMQAWTERTQGFRLPESEIRAVNRLDEDGRIIGPKPRDTRPMSTASGSLPQLKWESVDCPALALYAVTAPLETWMPHYIARYDSLSVEERERADAYVTRFAAWTAARRSEFARLPQNEAVEFPATGHYFFLKQPEQERALALIRQFVARLN